MKYLYDLKEILQISIERSGVQPLTNQYLLNLVTLSIKKAEKREERSRRVEFDEEGGQLSD